MNEGHLCAVEVGALNVGTACQNADVLPQRFLLNHGPKALTDFVAHQFEWQPFSRNALIDGHDVEAVTGLDQLPEQSGWP